jgi:hypothetical protein
MFGDFVFAKVCNIHELVEWIEAWNLLDNAHNAHKTHKVDDEHYYKPLIFRLFIGNLMNTVIDYPYVHPLTKSVAKAYHDWTRVAYSVTDNSWESPVDAYMFFEDKFLDRSLIFQSQQLILIGSAWKPMPIDLKT